MKSLGTNGKTEADPGWRLCLFGTVRLQNENKLIELGGKAAALLVYLSENSNLNRNHIAYLLWPDDEEAGRKKNLRNLFYSLGQKTRDMVLSDAQTIPLQNTQTDTDLFEQYEQEGTVDSLEKLVDNYQIGFYTDFSDQYLLEYASWLETTRMHYQERVVAALSKLSALHMPAGNTQKAIQTTHRWLDGG